MKTVVSEVEVNRVAQDAVSLALQKLPFNGQNDEDRAAARHLLFKQLHKQINGQLDKMNDVVKAAYKLDPVGNRVKLTDNYRIECTEGTPREMFDMEKFLKAIMAEYPDVLAHKLKEIALKSKSPSTPPISIDIEYIGDVNRG